MNAPVIVKPAAAVTQDAHDIIETVMMKGDLAKLTPEERTKYVLAVCQSTRLNPMTRPFEYVMLDGRLVLYARKDAAEQLRKINKVSIRILSRELVDDVYTVHVHATDLDGREDEDIGSLVMVYPAKYKNREGNYVPHPMAGKPLRGTERANAQMKAVTKAKRRVTLSISGLGLPDESEVEDMLAAAEPVAKEKAPSVQPPIPGQKKALPPRIGKKPAKAAKQEAQEPSAVLMAYEKALADAKSRDDIAVADTVHKADLDTLDQDMAKVAEEMRERALARFEQSAEQGELLGS